MLEKKLQEALDRYKSINKYTAKLLKEQETPAEEIPPAPEGDTGVPSAPEGTDVPPAPSEDPAVAEPVGDVPPLPDESDVEEIDITDLVNMTKSIKKDLENSKQDNSGVEAKMDSLFTKLDELEQKLSQMDNIISRIDELGSKIDNVKPKTPEEKLEMRSLDSYPFSQNPKEFFNDKQQQMKMSGKNEYVLTKNDVQSYTPSEIMKSFNPSTNEY